MRRRRHHQPLALWQHRATGDLTVWLMNGTVVTDRVPLTPRQVADRSWRIGDVADINRDGKPDILWHHQTTGELDLWFLDGITVIGASHPTPSGLSDVGWQIAPR